MKHNLTGYNRHGCRCDVCREAASAARKKSYAKHREKRRAESRAYAVENREESNRRVRAWVSANPERARQAARERTKRYADANRSTVRARADEWRAANPEKAASAARAWRQANPERSRQYAKLRRARLAGAEILQVTDRQWQRMLTHYRNRCAYCGCSGELQRDHVIPLTRGGRHSIGNLVPACKPCNSAKGNRTPVEWRAGVIRPSTRSVSLT